MMKSGEIGCECALLKVLLETFCDYIVTSMASPKCYGRSGIAISKSALAYEVLWEEVGGNFQLSMYVYLRKM